MRNRRRLNHHLRRRRKTPHLTKIGSRRNRPVPTRGSRTHKRTEGVTNRNSPAAAVVVFTSSIVVGSDAFSEKEGRRSQKGFMVERGGSRIRSGGGGSATEGGGDGGEASGSRAGTGGGDDGGFGLTEEPFDGLAVGFVTQFASELEDSSGADDRHTNTAAAAVDFAVAVFGRGFFEGQSGIGLLLVLVKVDYGAIVVVVGDGVGRGHG